MGLTLAGSKGQKGGWAPTQRTSVSMRNLLLQERGNCVNFADNSISCRRFLINEFCWMADILTIREDTANLPWRWFAFSKWVFYHQPTTRVSLTHDWNLSQKWKRNKSCKFCSHLLFKAMFGQPSSVQNK